MQPTSNPPTVNPSSLPGWLLKTGRYSAPLTVLWSIDMIYEQTLLTWSSGQQMVGFSVTHFFGPLILLSVLMSYIFLVGLVIFVLVRLLRGRALPKMPMPLILTLCVAIALTFIPYRQWRYAVFKMKGPGPHAAQALVWAAHDGDRGMVELLLDSGVPVDFDNQGATALEGACSGDQTEIARWLLSKGADINRAPHCKNIRLD